MKKIPKDLLSAVSGETARYMSEAIEAAKKAGLLSDDTALDGELLGEIRCQLKLLGREIRSSTKGESDKPIGKAIAFVEHIALHPKDAFWKPRLLLAIPPEQREVVEEMKSCLLEAEIVWIDGEPKVLVKFPRGSLIG